MQNLNLIAPCNVLGYGTAGYNLLVNLAAEFKVAYWPIGDIRYPVPDENKSIIQQALNNQADYNTNAPCIRIWHQFEMAQMVGRGQHIGFPIFELNRFNPREKYHLDTLDKVFVCSKWAEEIIKNEIGDSKPTHIVPLGVDREIFFDIHTNKTGPFIFLNVGKWEVRKGHDVLITAFNNAFNENDNVELWMMNHNPFLKQEQEKEWLDFYTKSHLGSKVKILPRVATQQELAHIMQQAHCGVFPARAEGWNLEVLEMMSCGRDVITTNFSAHTEFCNDQNCKLIPITDVEEAYDGIWFHGQGQWAKFDEAVIDKLSALMLESYRAGKHTFNAAGVETAKKFSWANSVEEIKKGLTH